MIGGRRSGPGAGRAIAAPLACAAIACSLSLLAADAAAFEPWPDGRRLFPAAPADPTQPAYSARLGGADGGRAHGDASLGDEFGVFSWGGGRYQVGVAAGVASRFDLSFREVRELQVADYSFTVPFDADLGPLALRLAYLHVSSHLGDDRLKATGAPVVKRASDEVHLHASAPFVPAAGFPARCYAGAGWAYNVLPKGAGRSRLQAGAEVRRPLATGGALFAAADLQARERSGWDPALTARAGWESPGTPAPLTLFLEYAAGPLPYLALANRSESRWSLGLTVRR